MVQKRPFDEDESIEVLSKQPRQLEPNKQLISPLEFPSETAVQSPHASGEGDHCLAKIKPGFDEKLDVACAQPLFSPKKDVAARASRSLPCSSWATSSICEEDIKLESPIHMPSPDYYNSERPPRTFRHHGESDSFLLEHPPRKVVAIGPDFQAYLPEWDVHGNQRTFSCSEHPHEASNLPCQALESVSTELLDSEKEFCGTCVIPMPDSMPPADIGKVGTGRIDCLCVDVGSIGCVQLHILEAREKLKRTLGHKAFVELGFCDMGEVVAEKWNEEDELLYHEVVFSNPASLGKNFWDHLAVVFPSRTKKEIVSYYFNVFVLRKRAEQNRFDSMNIDSDNDEWQGTDDSSDNEVEVDEDDDLVVESPVDSDRLESFNKSECAYDEDVSQTTSVGYHATDHGGCNLNLFETCSGEEHAKCSSDTMTQMSRDNHSHETGCPDIKNDTCTSDDGDIGVGVIMDKSDNNKHWTSHFGGTNGASDHEFMLEACNAREWDVGYVTRPRNDVDLLPTCSMIEEVFGTGSWNYKARDGQGLS